VIERRGHEIIPTCGIGEAAEDTMIGTRRDDASAPVSYCVQVQWFIWWYGPRLSEALICKGAFAERVKAVTESRRLRSRLKGALHRQLRRSTRQAKGGSGEAALDRTLQLLCILKYRLSTFHQESDVPGSFA